MQEPPREYVERKLCVLPLLQMLEMSDMTRKTKHAGRMPFSARGEAASGEQSVMLPSMLGGFTNSLNHCSVVVPWLREIEIVEHVYGLRKEKIRAAIAVPPPRNESSLRTVIDTMDSLP